MAVCWQLLCAVQAVSDASSFTGSSLLREARVLCLCWHDTAGRRTNAAMDPVAAPRAGRHQRVKGCNAGSTELRAAPTCEPGHVGGEALGLRAGLPAAPVACRGAALHGIRWWVQREETVANLS